MRLKSLILGPPGGGKGTIAKKIIKDFSFLHLSTGDVLRHHVRKGSEIGKKARGFMASGKAPSPSDHEAVCLPQGSRTCASEGRPRGCGRKRILVHMESRRISWEQNVRIFLS
jgi:hypothetical protein